MQKVTEQIQILRDQRNYIRSALISMSHCLCNIRSSDSVIAQDIRLGQSVNELKKEIVNCMLYMRETQRICLRNRQKTRVSGKAVMKDDSFEADRHLGGLDIREQQGEEGDERRGMTLQDLQDLQRQIIVEMDVYLADLKKFHPDGYAFGESVVQNPFSAFAFAYLQTIAQHQNQIQSLIQYKSNIFNADLSFLVRDFPVQLSGNQANVKGLICKTINLLKETPIRQIRGEYDMIQELIDISLMANLTQDVVDAVIKFKNEGQPGNFGFNAIARDFGVRILSQKESSGEVYVIEFETESGNVFYLMQNLRDSGFIFD